MSVITRLNDRPQAPATGPGATPSRRLRPRAPRMTWGRAGLAALLALTAVAYLWNLSESGYANSFYAAAVQAGTKSWKAMFFGSIDSSSFITVDKPPASLWVMELSGRIFGFSSWSMLAPQALEGVGAVWLTYASVKRWFGSGAGLAAGAILALTPVAALMFRFNNPDALLVLLLVASAYCLTRALERAGTRWIVVCGALLGFAFLTKMLQAFLVLPGFTLVYLYAAPTGLRRRLAQLLAGGAALLVSAGWWVAIVALWPAGSRPFIDGSPDNNIFNLIFGYNGLERVLSSGGSGGPGGGGIGFSGPIGLLRLFNNLMGGQASWLLPASLLALVAGVWVCGRAPRTDRRRAALLLWGSWLLVTAVVFSFGQGVIHTYYTVALAPAIAALVAIGGALLWERRTSLAARCVAAAAVVGTAIWAAILLGRTPSWEPWLRPTVLVCAGLAALGMLAWPVLGRLRGRALAVAVAFSAFAMLAGPVAYAAQTIGTGHTGSIPSAGPASNIGLGGLGGAFHTSGAAGGSPPSGGGFPGGGSGTRPSGGGGFPGGGSGTRPSGGGGFPGGGSGTRPSGGGGFPGGGTGAGGGASFAGASVSSSVVQALEHDAGRYRWVAATEGSNNAASLELATGGDPVMAIGGFNGNGGELTLAAFERYVKAGEIHYYIPSGGGGGQGGQSGSSAITEWVESHYRSTEIGGATVYDLTSALR